MKHFLPKLFVGLFIVTLSGNVFGQNEFEDDFLPKYPTQSERDFIQQQIVQKAEALQQRGPLSEMQRNASSCEGNCGEQAPGGCWCDELCVQYGDCCSDYQQFCVAEPDISPEDLIVPGEFEESQAVTIRWSYGSVSTSRTRTFVEMINAIQQEVPVWIFINNASDSTSVINAMNFYGYTLENHEFLVKQTNSIWIRDYGPFGFYYGEDDELAFLDIQYYPSRPLDNEVPVWLANHMGIDVYTSNLYDEGGNQMFDGFGHAFYADGIFPKNSSLNGWSTEFTRETHNSHFRVSEATEPERLLCDGGTGHLDMYAKLLNETTILASEYPAEVTASDRQRIEDNVALFESKETTYGDNFEVVRVPMPRRNDGSYSTSCSQINADARGYVNGLFVNKTFIVPIYTNESSSQFNKDWDEAALDQIREYLPGYNVIGVDARSLTVAGGAIHCVTMQIPADNPVRFRHERLSGVKPASTEYTVNSSIKNKSGIAEAKVYYRVKGAETWNEAAMSGGGVEFEGIISNTGFSDGDTITYYLEATTNNGKTRTHPIVAPEGYFSFVIDGDLEDDCEAPTGLFASNVTAGTATLNWTPVDGALSYTIRGTIQGSSNFQTLNVNNPNASSANVNILNADTDYQWQIRSNCEDGLQSDWADWSFFTTDVCNSPSGLNASNLSSTSATLSWDAAPGAVSYQLRGRPVGAPGYQNFNVGSTSLNTGNLLSPGTQYEWSVRSYCNGSQTATSSWSPSAFFTTPGGSAASDLVGSSDFGFELFPNPTSSMVNLAVHGSDQNVIITIADMTGRQVFQKQYPPVYEGATIEIQLGDLASGIYLVQASSDGQQSSQRLIIK